MTRGVVATPHHVASEVGAQILRDGSNAIDAAVAANAALCVVYPHITSIGEDLMAIVWAAGETSPIGSIGARTWVELPNIASVRMRGHDALSARGAIPQTLPGS